MFFFSVIVTAIEGKDVEFKQIKELENKDLSEETISVIYSGLMKLLQSALRLPVESLKQEVGGIVFSNLVCRGQVDRNL